MGAADSGLAPLSPGVAGPRTCPQLLRAWIGSRARTVLGLLVSPACGRGCGLAASTGLSSPAVCRLPHPGLWLGLPGGRLSDRRAPEPARASLHGGTGHGSFPMRCGGPRPQPPSRDSVSCRSTAGGGPTICLGSVLASTRRRRGDLGYRHPAHRAVRTPGAQRRNAWPRAANPPRLSGVAPLECRGQWAALTASAIPPQKGGDRCHDLGTVHVWP